MKKFFTTILATIMILTVIPTSVSAKTNSVKLNNYNENFLLNYGASPTAWPGRPGGNGDGSEEWLQGNYGQTNGPYRLIYSSQGNVNSLNNQQDVANSIGMGILGALTGQVFVGATMSMLSAAGLTVMGIATAISGGYQGAYYKSNTYISGRCMKTVIKTYKNSNYTGHVKTYIKYTKW